MNIILHIDKQKALKENVLIAAEIFKTTQVT